GAVFIQMEDEISALAAVLGASWAGKKAMTVTSGPGLSNMMEHIGLGVMLETPCVIVDVQRAGPSEGLPNCVGQGDVMQARWGSHGDYEIIAISPSSPQECFEFTIKAFNLSERYRVPVILLSDEEVAHMVEEVVIPPANQIVLEPRKYYKGSKSKYLPFVRGADLIPPIAKAGDGYRFHVTGLTHDERGYPIMNAECQEFCVRPLIEKIKRNAASIIEFEERETEDAEVIIVSYGVVSRVVDRAIAIARKDGIKVGSLRLIVIWPFPEKRIRELSRKVKTFIVPEINYGQIAYEVERCAAGNCNVVFLPHAVGSTHSIEDIFNAIVMVTGEKHG
ncbi:MAG TPA: 2-oxoacid:acceptor oxidoreductase subunit alpha, partial [bacterium (Candidatus Stahlbacteria)]|nr:2-oxoacid:acceptor oxidoreductase subunit alpha [Candidatus Stahlbacteria bacterium]